MSDDAFAEYVKRAGMATPEQVESAAKSGGPVSDALVRSGVITEDQKKAVLQRLEEKKAGIRELGPFRIKKKLGEGGMGAVYLAFDEKYNRDVALKVLAKHLDKDSQFLKRFEREAEAAVSLDHPNIARAYSAGQDRGFRYIALEFCEGRTVGDLLREKKRLDVDEAVRMIRGVAEGLAYAHERGFIHRDIKPDNIMVRKDGSLKILDLGLAKHRENLHETFKTVTGVTVGTPQYIAPEQATAEKGIDGRADLYSLGATFYHMVTGESPFRGDTALAVMAKHLNEPPLDPVTLRADLSPAVAAIILKMLAKKPEDRFQDCAELIDHLDRKPAPPAHPPLDRRKMAAILGVLGVILSVCIMALAWPEPDPRPEPQPQPQPQPEPVTLEPIDLIDRFDPELYRVERWVKQEGVLVSPRAGQNLQGGSPRFLIPLDLPQEYDLELTVERVEGNEDLVVSVLHDGRSVGFVLDGWWAQKKSGWCIGGSWRDTWSGGQVIPADGEVNIVCRVRRESITVLVDDRQILHTDAPSELGLTDSVFVGDNQGIIIGALRSVMRITRLRLLPR